MLIILISEYNNEKKKEEVIKIRRRGMISGKWHKKMLMIGIAERPQIHNQSKET
jgi:hypothetical protein